MREACRHIAWIIIFAVVFVAPIPTRSQAPKKEMDVQWLYGQCKEAKPSSQSFCSGFISGIALQMFWTGSWLIKKPPSGTTPLYDRLTNDDDRSTVSFLSACTELAASGEAMRQAFINWAEKHPQEWSADSQLGVMQAIHSAWRCPP
jgi:hypothetical protein